MSWLNFGCGRHIMPTQRPVHMGIIDADVFADGREWINADAVVLDERVECVSMIEWPWLWQDNSFDGFLLSHVVEHIPHHPNGGMQDGWMAFWSELYRVAKPGAVAHVLSPFAFSTGAMADPTHTRFITEQTFTHAGMRPPRDGETFEYVSDCHWRLIDTAKYRPTELFEQLLENGNQQAWFAALQTQWNVAYDIYVQMEAVK